MSLLCSFSRIFQHFINGNQLHNRATLNDIIISTKTTYFTNSFKCEYHSNNIHCFDDVTSFSQTNIWYAIPQCHSQYTWKKLNTISHKYQFSYAIMA